jgi:hypothetical protein
VGEGVVQVFRLAECERESLVVYLRGLDPDATYILTNLDLPKTTEISGSRLMNEG